MLAYTPVSEAGGVGKTTTAGTLAVAHARAGLDVLCIDLDTQNGSLTYLFGPDGYDRGDSSADNLVKHMVDSPEGPFDGLVETVEAGVDLIPSHNMLEDLPELLIQEQEKASKLGRSYSVYHQLHRVLDEANVRDRYDVLIVDTAGKAGPVLYNALVATGNVVIPFEATAKGQESIEGLDDLVTGLEENTGVDVGVLAVVPIGFKGTNDQQEILDELREGPFDVPIVIGERASLMEGSWRQQCSPFAYVDEHRSRERDHEMDTLEAFEDLARHLEREAGIVEGVA
ncbi:ParA family protein [Halosegnis longus]|uniref:ParA family protein n=1 Tax=Halosegnis longus TaxID=2216012 RepID=UPI00129DD4DB|nr:ParA family protein [Halosegnis longus]